METNKLKNKRVFVSGGAGVIGRELVARLLKADALVFVGDLKSRPTDFPKEVIYRQGDLNYISKEEIEDFAPEYFIHLAASFERSTETYGFWEENFNHNVRLSHHLMTILKDCPSLRKVIFASSYLIYNPDLYNFKNPQKKPRRLTEEDPIYPRNLTGVAKLSHEIELRFLTEFKSCQFQTISARIFRSYGKNSNDVISRWIRSLLAGERLSVFRKEGMFDYIFAGDVAEGLLRLAASDNASGICNVGRGRARAVSEVLHILEKHFPGMSYVEEKSDIPYEASEADTGRLFKTTQWTPTLDLEETIPEIITHEKKRLRKVGEEPAFNVLMTSISKKIPMIEAVKNACKKIGPSVKLFGADADPNCVGKYFVDCFWQMPKLSTLHAKDIIQYCRQNKIIAIIPSRDGELLFFATIKEELEKNGIAVMVSNVNSVQLCLDKFLFSEELRAKKLPAIPTALSAEELSSHNLVVKDQFGAGSHGILVNVGKKEAIAHSKKLEHPIFQPFVAGREYSVDVFSDKNSTVKGVVVRTRDLVVHGESQITTTVSHKALEALAKKVVQHLGLIGHCILQVLEDEKGQLHIIEANCRFGGASTLSVASGLDSFYWFLLEANKVDLKEYRHFKPSGERKQIRYPKDMVIEVK